MSVTLTRQSVRIILRATAPQITLTRSTGPRLVIATVVTGPPGPAGEDGASVPTFASLTTDTTIDAANNGTLYNNTGAVADLVATLPAAVVGLAFGFRVSAAFNLGVSPSTGDVITMDDITVADTQQLQSDLAGATVDIECHVAGEWFVTNIRRPWAVE